MNQFREYGSDEAKLKVYHSRVAQAQAKLDEWSGPAKLWVQRYENKPNPNQFSGNGHHVTVPTGISIIDSLYSSLTATDVSVIAHAVGQGSRTQEELASAALEKEWDIAKVNRRTNKAIKDALLVGIGWVKVAYEYASTFKEVPRTQLDVANDIQALVLEAEEAGHDIDAPTIASYVPLTEEVEEVLVERIVVDYVPWDRVLWDPVAKQVEDIRWVAQVTLMHPEEVKSHPSFREYCARNRTTRKLNDLGGDSFVNWGDGDPEQNDDNSRVTVIELWDFETGTVCTFAKNAGFLLNEAPNPFALNEDLEDKSPFVPIILRQSPGRVRGVSEMEVLTPTLEEMDLYHSRLATYLERMAPKVVGPKGALSDSGKEAMASQEYGAFVELENGFNANDITDFKPPALPAELYGVPEKLEMAAKEATGLNELMRGLFPDRKRTATETSEVVQAGAARQAEKRVALQAFLEGIARRILQLMQMFYTSERMVRYVDFEEGAQVEWSFTAEDIVLESRLEVVLTPKEEKTWQSRRDDALAVLNILGPLAQPNPTGESVVDQAELIRFVLQELGIPRQTILLLLNLPEEQQAQKLAAQQDAAAMQAAQSVGVPRPDMTPGPLDAGQLAAATNQGEIPPEVLAAAFGNTPVSPQATEVVSESVGPAV